MNTTTEQDRPVSRNPFAVTVQQPAQVAHTSASGDSDQQRAIAEVQAAMMIARMNPRDQVAAMDRILNACSRKSLAEVAVYSYARGGSEISGPSIRLAEGIAQQWGNLQFGIRELEQRGGESTVQAYAWDVETNTRREMTFQVKHERHTKRGVTRLTDPRDIYELTANQGARRLRSCLLAVIPGDVVEAAVNQCEATIKSSVEITPERLQKMSAEFEKYGVSKEQIEKRIQRRLDTIQPAQFLSLMKIHNSLRDGMSKPGDWFEVADTPSSGAAVAINDQIKAKADKPKPPTGRTVTDDQDAAPDYAAMIAAAHDLDACDVIGDMLEGAHDEKRLRELLNARRVEIDKA